MTKKQARAYYKEKRAGLSASQLEKWNDLILIRFQQLNWPMVNIIHSYAPSAEKKEPDPEPLVRYLQFIQPGLQTAAPRTVGGDQMVHLLVNDDTQWLPNKFGILEPSGGQMLAPEDIDMVMVPLLAFDLSGNRVGYGKGYYDRFLAQCRKDVITVGLSYFEPLELVEDWDPWDLPLQYCITPEQVYEF